MCGGGDVVELVRRIEGCDYAKAAQHLLSLAQRPDLTLPTTPFPRHPRPGGAFRPFLHNIPLNPRVPFLQDQKGISVSTAKRFETGSANRSLFLQKTVAVRLHDLQGMPLGYCGRRLELPEIERWGKWRFPTAFPKASILYNVHRALSSRAAGIVVVECPWAVMRLAQSGVMGAVALLGTSLSETQVSWIATAPKVLVLFDGDRAGQQAAIAVSQRLASRTNTVVYELQQDAEPEDLSDFELTTLVNVHLSAPSSL
jgi:5S rRNA maturation endonuclease (ribonuclease M5)